MIHACMDGSTPRHEGDACYGRTMLSAVEEDRHATSDPTTPTGAKDRKTHPKSLEIASDGASQLETASNLGHFF